MRTADALAEQVSSCLDADLDESFGVSQGIFELHNFTIVVARKH
jgi:hypothetical protein